MSFQRSLGVMLMAGLLCGTAMAGSDTASGDPGISRTQGSWPPGIAPDTASGVFPGINPDSPNPTESVPEIFPQAASQTIATAPTTEVMVLPPASEAIQTQAATHPKAHETAPLLSSFLTSGWMLMNIASAPKVIPFLDVPGYRATYQLPGRNGQPQEFITDILMIASEPDAISAYELLSKQDSLGTTTETLEMPGLKRIKFQEGKQDSPAASSQAAPITASRITVWFPPFVLLIQGQNVQISAGDVKDILSSLSWRE